MPPTILVVEDTPANLDLMEYLLHAFGYTVLTATDGHEALVRAREDRPDLIVCDVQLPGLDGHEVAQRLKADESLRHIPLVAVTALAMVGDRDRVLASGFDGYIAKPIDPQTFVREIETFLPGESQRPSPVPHRDVHAAAAPRARAGRTILVVDNLAVNLELARSILEHHGYAVLAADGLVQALERLQEHAVDIILSDVCMGADSGHDLIRRVKADGRLRSIPFVFLTSTKIEPTDRAAGIALGAARYLARPIDAAVLLAELQACIDERGEA